MSAGRIRDLNDAFRRSFAGGHVTMTAGIAGLPEEARRFVLDRVRAFDAFTPENDPHGEHDFGSFDHKGCRVCWKIDYYDLGMEAGSDDAADPTKTNRVLTIMLASEY